MKSVANNRVIKIRYEILTRFIYIKRFYSLY